MSHKNHKPHGADNKSFGGVHYSAKRNNLNIRSKILLSRKDELKYEAKHKAKP